MVMEGHEGMLVYLIANVIYHAPHPTFSFN